MTSTLVPATAYQRLRDVMAKLCCMRVRVNSLWQWIYSLLLIIAEGYLLYRAVAACREYNELPWRTEIKPVSELYVYITFIVISIMCIPFFVICAIFKVGNYGNDGIRLGRDDVYPRIRRGDDNMEDEPQPSNWKLLWRHSGPLAVGFHIMSAFSLLLPIVLMDAQKIKYGFLQPSAIWRSELDVLVEGDRSVSFVATESYNHTPFVVQPQEILGYNQWDVVSPEFVNYVAALVLFSVHYPAVFWYTKMAFSFVFALQLLVSTAFYMLAFCNMAVLYKFQVNHVYRPDIQLMLPPSAIVVLYLMSCVFVYFSSIAIFNYGFAHYNDIRRKYLKTQGWLPNKPSPPPTGCEGYVPHTAATVALVLFVTSRAPLVYDGVTIYRKTGNTICLASIVWDVCYMLVWIITWFCFTIKQTWEFKIRTIIPPVQRGEVYMIRNDLSSEPVVTVTGPMTERDESDHGGSHQMNVTNASIEHHREHPVESPPLVPPHSPAGVMKKGGDRKNHNTRVTFEAETSLDNPKLAEQPLIIERGQPRRRSKERSSNDTPSRKRKRKADSERITNNNEGFEMDEPYATPVRTQSARASKSDPDGLEFTPENTLVRNYRHSIRDKCGQYYRRSDEFAAPPAAQSSPVLPPRRRSDKPHREPPAPPRGSKDDLVVHRQPSPVRSSGPRSLSPARPPPMERPSSTNPYPKPPPRKPIIVEPKPNKHAFDDLHDPRRSHSPRDLMRELKIVNNKPDIGRRDSALPSSNETSSNESGENVLCSQV